MIVGLCQKPVEIINEEIIKKHIRLICQLQAFLNKGYFDTDVFWPQAMIDRKGS